QQLIFTLFPYTTLFRSEKFAINRFDSEISWTKENKDTSHDINKPIIITALPLEGYEKKVVIDGNHRVTILYANNVSTINGFFIRSEEHTSELQSRFDLV